MTSMYFDDDDDLLLAECQQELERRSSTADRLVGRRYETEQRFRRGSSKVSGVHCRREKRTCP